MKGRAKLLLTIVTAALFVAFGWAVLTISGQNSKAERAATSPAQTDAERAYRTQIESIRTRVTAGERISLIVQLKLNYRDSQGQPVPIAELERAKAEVLARLAGRGIESARSMANATALQMIVTTIEGLDRILSDPMVREIWENRRLRLQVDESRQIIHATLPWNYNTSGTQYTGNGFAIAIMDTGVDPSIIPVDAQACFSTSDPGSYIGTLCPNFVSTPPSTLTNPPSAVPCTGFAECDHGTHVAGIAVGTSTTPGIAPQSSVVAIQVFSNYQGELYAQDGDIKQALAYVALYNNSPLTAKKIISVNMSLGRPGNSADCTLGGGLAPEIVELKKLGVTLVAASGNDSDATQISWPACVNIPPSPTTPNDTTSPAGVISVGSTNKWDVVSPFSNSSPQLDMLAPGAGIKAVLPTAPWGPGGTGFKSGTSMAAPHVAGCVALLAEEAKALAVAGYPFGVDTPDIFENALKATGIPIWDWRDFNYSIMTPRLDCGAALWKLRGQDHLATISGWKTENNTGQAGWIIEAFRVSKLWPGGINPAYFGHLSYSTITDSTGYYQFKVPWGVYQLGESPYGPFPSVPSLSWPSPGPVPSTATTYWKQIPVPNPIDVNTTAMGPFQNNNFANQQSTFCPVGQDYMVLLANQKDHFAMWLDQAAPNTNLQLFFADRYNPQAPPPMRIDENNWSTRAFIHTFNFSGPSTGGKVVTKARFDIGARPVIQPRTNADGTGTYPPDSERLERNDAVWLLFPDANGGILGNPTAWGRGIGPEATPLTPGSIIGPGLLATPWDYPNQQLRYDFAFPLPGPLTGAFPLPGLPMPGPNTALPNYVVGDIRPMINLHRQVGLFVQDDTGVDYAAMHLCMMRPGIAITKMPTGQPFNTGDPTTFDLTVTNTTTGPIPSSGNTLQVSDTLPPGFAFDPTLNPSPNSSGIVYTNWGTDWSCTAKFDAPGDSKFVCKYIGTGLAAGASTTIKAPVKAMTAGTHQNCASVDVVNPAGDIVDHNDACSVNAVGYDIGVRKRKSQYMIRWGNPDSSAPVDPGASVQFMLSVRNFGQQLNLAQATISLEETISHNGFQFIPGTLVPGADWNCGVPSLPLSFTCTYTGASLSQPGVVPPGFMPSPLQLERGYPLAPLAQPLTVEVRGNETGWWQNCAKVTLTGYTDEVAANDKWCVNVFVQGNIAVAKTTSRANPQNVSEYDFVNGQSELIDVTINVSNLAGKIDAPLKVKVYDQLPSGLSLDNVTGFAGLSSNWTCSPGSTIECIYNAPIDGVTTYPINGGISLDPIKLNLRANKPGIYKNCATAEIKAGPTPVDDQPDAISPPDPPPPIKTDFEPTNNDQTNKAGCTLIIVGHDIQLVKSASDMTPNAGTPFTFNFTITNNLGSIGPNEQLVVTDTLPSGFAIGTLQTGGVGAWNCGSSGSINTGWIITCTFETGPNVIPASVLPALSLPVVSAPTKAGPYQNCAVLVANLKTNDGITPDDDDIPGNNDQTNPNGCVTINVPGHLNIAKASDKTEYNLGDPIKFYVTITNPLAGAPDYGSTLGTPLTINFSEVPPQPPSIQVVSVGWPPAWLCPNSSLTCTLPPGVQIGPGDHFDIIIDAVGSSPGRYTNCFTVALSVGGAAVPNDPTAGNPCVDFYVGHDVAITKSVDNPTPQFGGQVNFTLSVSNTLGSIAPPQTVSVTDTLPVGLTLTTNLGTLMPPWNCGSTGGGSAPTIITCTYTATADAGTPLSPINLQATVNAVGALNNCASVALVGVTDDISANNGNNETVCAPLEAQAGYLAIYKIYDPSGGFKLTSPFVPSDYTTIGFPIRLSCSSFNNVQIAVPIKADFFSSNDPNLTSWDPNHSMSGPGPTTTPTVPGTNCLVTEAQLPPIQNVCQGGSAFWVTTYTATTGTTTTTGTTGVNVTIQAGQTSTVTVTNKLMCEPGYLAIFKVYDDQTTGGTPLTAPPMPSNYITSGFPIQLSCPGYFPGQITVPIRAKSFSSNDQALVANPPTGFTSMTAAASTNPSPAGLSCTVSENNGNPLPTVTTAGCTSGRAYWTTTFSPTTPSAPPVNSTVPLAVQIPVNGTVPVTVTNTLKCTDPCMLDSGMVSATFTAPRRITLAQTFTPAQTGTLTQITHGLQNISTVQSYDLLVTTTNGGLPSWTGGSYTSSNVLLAMTGLTIFSNSGMVNAVVPIPSGQQPHLTAGTQYALILIPGPPATGNMAWRGNALASSYPNGSAYELNGTTWSVPGIGPKDHGFKLDGLCP